MSPAVYAEGADYSYSRPNLTQLAALLGHGFVFRYISGPAVWLASGKNVTAAEVAAIHAAGLGVGIVYESTAGFMLGGGAQATADASNVRAWIRALALPAGVPVRFALDLDANPAQLAASLAYLQQMAALIGWDRTSGYGGVRAVDYWAANTPGGGWWQTYAWSAGRISPAAAVLQYANDVALAGGLVDRDRLLVPPEAAGIWWPQPWPKEEPMSDAESRGWGPGWPSTSAAAHIVHALCGANKVDLPVRAEIAILCDYLVRALEASRGRPFVQYGCWGYANRAVKGSDPPVASNHSWGLAIDLDAPNNAFGNPTYGTMPGDAGVIAGRFGFRWGGSVRVGGAYAGTPDPMHYEYMGTPALAAALTKQLTTAEVDMTPAEMTAWALSQDGKRALATALLSASYFQPTADGKAVSVNDALTRLLAGVSGLRAAVAAIGSGSADLQPVLDAVAALSERVDAISLELPPIGPVTFSGEVNLTPKPPG